MHFYPHPRSGIRGDLASMPRFNRGRFAATLSALPPRKCTTLRVKWRMTDNDIICASPLVSRLAAVTIAACPVSWWWVEGLRGCRSVKTWGEVYRYVFTHSESGIEDTPVRAVALTDGTLRTQYMTYCMWFNFECDMMYISCYCSNVY